MVVLTDTAPSNIEPDDTRPAAYRLGQYYPNPFISVTTIPFDLPADGMVRLEIYNALGQRIAVSVNRRMPAGHHALVFDASEFTSGLFFYRVNAGQEAVTGKMLYMK